MKHLEYRLRVFSFSPLMPRANERSNLLWGSSADTNYLILVKNTSNESDSQLLCCFVSELSTRLTILRLFYAFNYFVNLCFFFFNRYSCICTVLRCPTPQMLTLFLINLLKQSALFCLILEGLNVSLTFPQFHKCILFHWRFLATKRKPSQSCWWMLHSSDTDFAYLVNCDKFAILSRCCLP